MSDITITLSLSSDEMERFNDYVQKFCKNRGDYVILDKVTRAIERGESFVNDDESGNTEMVCPGCAGTGHLLTPGGFQKECYYCSGTGKGYV